MENTTEQSINDIKIVCKECGVEFILTEGEQKFYEANCYNLPKRCKKCRDERKARYNQ